MVMYDTFGKSFHEDLAAQKPVFSRDIANSERRVARGEFPLYIPFSLQDFGQIKSLRSRSSCRRKAVPISSSSSRC